MTIVEGQIEPLKKLKEILIQKGITRFNSIGSINKFLKNYDSEKNKIPKDIGYKLDLEIKNLQSSLLKHQQFYDDLKVETTNKANIKLKNLQDEFKIVKEKRNKSLIRKVFFFPKYTSLKLKASNLENNFEKIIRRKTHSAEHEVIKIKNNVEHYLDNKENIVLERCSECYKDLAYTKEVLDELYTLIAGAIGESSVVKELQSIRKGDGGIKS